MIRLAFLAVVFVVSAQLALAQSAATLLDNAQNLNRYGQSLSGQSQVSVLMDVRRILNRILIEYPQSPEATAIRAGGQLGDLNVAILDNQIAGGGTANVPLAAPQPVTPLPPVTQQPLTPLPPLNDQQQNNQGLMSDTTTAQVMPPPLDGKERMKMVQEALNRAGCETGTPDGVPGRKTRRGYSRFLSGKGMSEDALPIDSDAFWQVLMSSQGEVCEPLPIVAVSPRTISGNWKYRARCGSKSRMPGERIDGILNIRWPGGSTFSGSLRNSQGLRAKVSGRVSGRKVTATANFGFLFGRVQFVGYVEEERLVINGSDSNRCRVSAWKS